MAKKEQEKVTGVPVMPLGYRQLTTQVAGHKFEASNAAAVGMLQDAGEGKVVFKPLGKPECGMRELNFYESLSTAAAETATAVGALTSPTTNTDNDLLNGSGDAAAAQQQRRSLLTALSAHVPRYYGHLKLIVNDREHTFLRLEDLTHNMAKPCVIDVKVGRRTWDPLSSPHKRAIEEQKYVICKQNLGLCLPGFQVYQQDPRQPEKTVLLRHGRDYGKSLNVQGFHQALAMFFNTSTFKDSSDVLLLEVLSQLRSIMAWFKRQRLLHFYASSLLICYDFEQLQKISPRWLHNGYHQNPIDSLKPDEWIRVRCIDFAHIFPAADAEPDQNYMFGLQSLIDIVESFLQR